MLEKQVAQQAGSLMNPSQFVKYIADHPELKPSVTFVAHGYREAIVLGPGPVVADFPRGQAFIFPDYFAFLTTRNFPGGMQQFEEIGEMFWKNLVIFAKTANKFNKWTSNPASIALDIAKALGNSKEYQEPKIIQKALTNPRSFFFPLGDLIDVVAGAGAGGRRREFKEGNLAPYFKLKTPDETYVVQMAMQLAVTPASIIRSIRESRNWQPRAFELLQEAAARNKSGG
jgi:hypothetical protein